MIKMNLKRKIAFIIILALFVGCCTESSISNFIIDSVNIEGSEISGEYELYGVYPDDFTSEEIDEIESIGALKIIKGDSDENGVINSIDFLHMISYIISPENITVKKLMNSDVNKDRLINSADLLLLKKILIKVECEDESAEEYIKAEEYLNRIGTINKKYDISISDNLKNERDICNMLEEKGFTDMIVSSDFDMDGNYLESVKFETSDASLDEYPVYDTYYISQSHEIWSISIVNGKVFANPIFYNLQENIKVPVVVSETNYIISYDNVSNQYFELNPDDDEIRIKVVSKITPELLDELTYEEMEKK